MRRPQSTSRLAGLRPPRSPRLRKRGRRLRHQWRFRARAARTHHGQHARLGRPRRGRRYRRGAVRIPYHRRRAAIARPRLCADRAAVQPPAIRQRVPGIRARAQGTRDTADRSHRLPRAACTRPIAARRHRPTRRSSPMRATTWTGWSRSSPMPRACSTWTAAHAKPVARVGGQRRRADQCSQSRPGEQGDRSSGCAAR